MAAAVAAPTVRVFGKPITHGTRTQRALAALNNQNADGKLDQVLLFKSQQQKGAAGAATVSTTIGKVYNATGGTLKYVNVHDWEGKAVGNYPVEIQNGQWAVFLHVGTRGAAADRKGSVGALVYRIEDYSDSMIAWNNPWKRSQGGNNKAYCEMNDPDYFDDSHWDDIRESLNNSGKECQTDLDGYATKVSIDEGGNVPDFTVTFYLIV